MTVHLVLAHRGCEPDLLPQVTHLVDAPVARGIDLDEVEVAPVADRDAALAAIAGVPVLRHGAVHGLGDDPRDRGLPNAPRAREQIGVRDLSAGDRVAQGAGDVILANDLAEGLRSVSTVEGGALRHEGQDRASTRSRGPGSRLVGRHEYALSTLGRTSACMMRAHGMLVGILLAMLFASCGTRPGVTVSIAGTTVPMVLSSTTETTGNSSSHGDAFPPERLARRIAGETVDRRAECAVDRRRMRQRRIRRPVTSGSPSRSRTARPLCIWPCTLRRSRRPEHAHAPRLGPGLPAARSDDRLALLPSGPDAVHGPMLHRTRSSTPRRADRTRDPGPQGGNSAPLKRIAGTGHR